ncbi:hypothetical protein [Bacillus benzoevorans]|uniref:Heat shock protein HspQ n=1 Tax=Bacillus benzoevorans TaxID=1456 RepID=A0A7X0HRN3_9BACI|nr:hypothetical protein [Bacillus benzoevorans]MBB6444557.1 heat shock protein HspQ [Bacillus benzoevorans]
MGRRKKAKYNIGDTVVITIYGTVGKVTDVNFLFLLERKSGIIHVKNRGDTVWH